MAKLHAAERNALPDSDFAGPDRSYPINDASHARNALSRVSQNGSPAEKAEVREKVHEKYPDIGKGGDPKQHEADHKELKRKLGVPEHQDIPHHTMQDAMAGKHGPEIQEHAKRVHDHMQQQGANDDQRAADMQDVFAGNRGQSAAPPAPKAAAPPQAPGRDDRYDFGD